MSEDEIREFEKNPNVGKIVQVRYLDDAGKRQDMETPDYWYFAPMVQRIVDTHCAAQQRGAHSNI